MMFAEADDERAKKLADALTARLTQRKVDEETATRAWIADARANAGAAAAARRYENVEARFGADRTAREAEYIERIANL
ncbi:hypothetical protein [Microbacterium enclense]|uniref:Uncharacterized protein n=1 Tax=Microbacterium enclense TaxID=993073 RepID=A0A1G6HMA1_9MICO|nr:hypothetical protein [Microbacterium enclense]SDB95389.1 hypothetical protein SAMN05216418_1344 [Microbacterium enclense]